MDIVGKQRLGSACLFGNCTCNSLMFIMSLWGFCGVWYSGCIVWSAGDFEHHLDPVQYTVTVDLEKSSPQHAAHSRLRFAIKSCAFTGHN